MRLRYIKPIIAAVLAMSCSLALGESYQIDLIVFEQKLGAKHKDMVSHELWPNYVPTPYPVKALRLIDAGEVFFNPLPKEQHLLSFHEKRLAKSDNYTMLWHKSWVQPLEPAQARPIIIDNSEETPEDLSLHGTIKVSKKRFQQVSLNLLVQHGKQSFHLSEFRNVKGEGLQYFDHPKIGALLMIKPVEETQAGEDDASEITNKTISTNE